MGNICDDQGREVVVPEIRLSLGAVQPPSNNFHTPGEPTRSKVSQSSSHHKNRCSSLIRSQNLSSGSHAPHHKLVVEPPSEHSITRLNRLENQSQVPSDFFNKYDMSLYFKTGKSQKENSSQRFSFKNDAIQSKISKVSKSSGSFNNLAQNTQKKAEGNESMLNRNRVSKSELRPNVGMRMTQNTNKSMISMRHNSTCSNLESRHKNDII